jgi:hypothetical protein
MKKFLILLVASSLSCNLHAQWWIYDLNTFESPDSLLTIDTTLIGNIWQIGVPQKIFFDNAWSVPNAIVTDLTHNYPKGNFSAFVVKIADSAFFVPRTSFQFYHKYDTDSLHDGGYLEVSYDGGNTWLNIADDPLINYYYDQDHLTNPVIANGNAAYTGRSVATWGLTNGWRWEAIFWCYMEHTGDVYLRFVFSSDTIQTNREGWMIDNIEVNTDICEGIDEHVIPDLVSLSPNPACDMLQVTRKFQNTDGTLRIFDMKGRILVDQEHFSDMIIDLSNFPEGTFILRYSDTRGYTSKKFVVLR